MASLEYSGLILVCVLALLSCTVTARPATFLQDFRITWADSHIRQLDGGRAIQLVLDQSSGDLYYYLVLACYLILFVG